MKKININLTASRALLLFESAARLGSFSRAAEDMKVGQPAVSHGVRQLEEVLGTRLFNRRPRGVELTEAGSRLFGRLQAGYAEIHAGIQDVLALSEAPERVTLMVSTSLASYWLMPRVPEFKKSNPGVDLRCITQDTDRDVRTGDYDLCIPLGRGTWAGFQAWKFADEEIFAVCSPGYREGMGHVSGPVDLLSHDLLILEERYVSRVDWYQWFRHVGVAVGRNIDGAVSNDYSIVLQAAVSGQGIALGWRHVVQPLLDQGLLVRAVPDSVRTEHPFFIIARQTADLQPAVAALRDWLIGQMRDFS
jgi:DNA-binding transcriptional LysR family regulator